MSSSLRDLYTPNNNKTKTKNQKTTMLINSVIYNSNADVYVKPCSTIQEGNVYYVYMASNICCYCIHFLNDGRQKRMIKTNYVIKLLIILQKQQLLKECDKTTKKHGEKN